jgi:hypothetical protein
VNTSSHAPSADRKRSQLHPTGRNASDSIHNGFLIVGLVCLVIINILFMVDIELTLRRNKADQVNGDNEWGFGQVLALLLLVAPLNETWNASRENAEESKAIQKRFEELFRRMCEPTSTTKLERLIHDGANPYKPITNASDRTCLDIAVRNGKAELITLLLRQDIMELCGERDTLSQVKDWCCRHLPLSTCLSLMMTS